MPRDALHVLSHLCYLRADRSLPSSTDKETEFLRGLGRSGAQDPNQGHESPNSTFLVLRHLHIGPCCAISIWWGLRQVPESVSLYVL